MASTRGCTGPSSGAPARRPDFRHRHRAGFAGKVLSMKFLFVMDPLARIYIAGDSTFALMLESQTRGHEIWFCEPRHLGLEHERAMAVAWPVTVRRGTGDHYPPRPPTPAFLDRFGGGFMRQGPPFDLRQYLAAALFEPGRG